MVEALIGAFSATAIGLIASGTGHLIFFGISMIAVFYFYFSALSREHQLNDRITKLKQEIEDLKRRL